MMERATPSHFEGDRSQRGSASLARRLWSYLVHWLRPSGAGTAPPAPQDAAAAPPDKPSAPLDKPPAPQAPPAAPVPAAAAPRGRPVAPAPPEPVSGEAGVAVGAALTETAVIDRRPARAAPLISVVAVAAGWSDGFAQSVGSLLHQTYSFWELVVVDTSTPPQPPHLVATGDGRVRVLSAAGLNDAAARHRGLEAAQGQLVTWLTAGVAMAPGWLHGLAWAVGEWPGVERFLGAPAGDATDRIVLAQRRERTEPAAGAPSSAQPAPGHGEGDRHDAPAPRP